MNPCRRTTPFVCLLILATTPLFAQRVPGPVSLSLASATGAAETVSFHSVEGLSSESAVVEYRSGAEPDVVRKMPGALKYANITLKRGITADTSLAAWRKRIEDGQFDQARRNGSIAILDHAGRPVARWSFENAWPAKYHLETDESTGAIREVIVLAVDRSSRQ